MGRIFRRKKEKSLSTTFGDRLFNIANTLLLVLIFIVLFYPMLIVISSSFSSPMALMSGKVKLFPVDFTLMGYSAVLKHKQILTGFFNSAFYMVFGTAINMVVTVMAAYPLSRRDLWGKGFLSFLFAFSMFFSGGLIPSYLLVRDLGMIDTRWALLIPCAMSVWNMVIVKTYFQNNIPTSVFEAAKIDGCSDIQYLIRIAIPISKPVIAVIALYYAVAHWNVFTTGYIYIRNPELQPLQVVLRDILLLNQMQDMTSVDQLDAATQNAQQLSELLKYSLIIVSSLPMIILYALTQKHFTKGIMVGSVKG